MNTRPLILSSLLAAGLCLGVTQTANAGDGFISSIHDVVDYHPDHVTIVRGYGYPRHGYHHGRRYGHHYRHHGKRHHNHYGHHRKHRYGRHHGHDGHHYDHHDRYYRYDD